MGLNPVSDPVLDQNFRYLERLIKSSQQQGVIAQQTNQGKQNLVFNRNWVGQGLVWLLHRLSVLAEPDQGISVSKAGVATKRKADYGIDCDSTGLLIKIKANEGLLVGSDGLATKRKAGGGILADSSGLYVDLGFVGTIYIPDSLTLNTGTAVGDVTDVQILLDGNIYAITDAVGDPGFNVEFDFVSVASSPKWILIRLNYTTSISLGMAVDIYNYVSVGYDRLHSFLGTQEYMFIIVPILDATNYIDGTNNMKIRLYQYSTGDGTNVINVDYIALWAKA